MFKPGDAVVHPTRGAGIVTGFKKFGKLEEAEKYYQIQLFGGTQTSLMIPVSTAEEHGLRPATPVSKLEQVWKKLQEDPEKLAKNHRTRYRALEDKLQTGDVFQIAEAVRDISWRRRVEEGLTVKGRRLYKRAMQLLAGEIAASEGIDLQEAQDKIRGCLGESFDSLED